MQSLKLYGKERSNNIEKAHYYYNDKIQMMYKGDHLCLLVNRSSSRNKGVEIQSDLITWKGKVGIIIQSDFQPYDYTDWIQ